MSAQCDDALGHALIALQGRQHVWAATHERFLTPTIGGGWSLAALPPPSWDPRSLDRACPPDGMEGRTGPTHEIPMPHTDGGQGHLVPTADHYRTRVTHAVVNRLDEAGSRGRVTRRSDASHAEIKVGVEI
jgi:hypothetical protein